MNAEAPAALIVSYHYAPSQEVGALRFSHLAAEWERLGVRTATVAASLPAGATNDPAFASPGLARRCAPQPRLPFASRTTPARVANRVLRPIVEPVGWEITWARPAIQAGIALGRALHRGVVVGTMPPRVDGIVASALARRLNWPLVLDYRDPWSGYPWKNELSGPVARAVARRVETACLRASRARVFNTPEMREWFEKFFPWVPSDANFVIPNGITPISPSPVAVEPTNDIVYAGNIYMDRTLLPVLRSLRALRVAGTVEGPARVVVYGGVPAWHRALTAAEGLDGYIEVRERVSKSELQRVIQSARFLIVLSGHEAMYAVPGKIYDYLSSPRPILAIAPSGSALHRFVRETGAAVFADPTDESAVAQAVEHSLRGAPRTLDARVIESYSWSSLAAKYLRVIQSVSESTSP